MSCSVDGSEEQLSYVSVAVEKRRIVGLKGLVLFGKL